MTAFAELLAASNFSFLRGASHPQELVAQAQDLALGGLAIADRNTLAGVVRGHIKAKDLAFPHYRVGCRLAFVDGTPDIAVWPRDRAAYGRLTRLLTIGNLRGEKAECILRLPDLLEWGEGLIVGVIPDRIDRTLEGTLDRLRSAFRRRVRLMAAMTYGPGDRRRLATLRTMARRCRAPLVATNDVRYHHYERRPLQDVVTAIREHVTLAEGGHHFAANAERHLKPGAEMARLFRDAPEAIDEANAVFAELGFSLAEIEYQYPDEDIGDARDPQEALEKLTREMAVTHRYPGGVPAKVEAALAHEFALIAKKNYAPYFLTVYEMVRFARSVNILCQGRGSAANSAVCYCLGITDIDPMKHNLLFERFLSENRDEPPDIDVDFEHERREEVMQHIYEKYGRDRAGIAATVITYRSRSAVREVGKVFGLSDDAIGALAGSIWGWSSDGIGAKEARRVGLDPEADTTRKVLALSREIIGFPRHLSQHVGGYVITRDRLDDIVPIGNAAMEDRTFVEWDKDDLDALKILKVDVLALGMLTCIRKSFDFLQQHYGVRPEMARILGQEEKAVYDMLCRADSLGVFQVESRAQMTMLPRLRPRKFYDLVIEVAIVRPGPIQGNMVHPYLRRRQGIEPVVYPMAELEPILKDTLGVPLFQEQAMKIAIVAAGFTPGQSDGLRRAMATFRHSGTIGNFEKLFIDGMVGRGYPQDFAERCFSQIKGFGEYGFPESHSASFSLLVYVSSWLKCHYPDVFCAALLNSQPMGFYAPAQIVRDARDHGVDVREVDINLSDWDNRLQPETAPPPFDGSAEDALERLAASVPDAVPARDRIHSLHDEMRPDIRSTHAVRLGFRQIKGFAEADGIAIMAHRGTGYDSVRDLWLRSGLSRAAIERLAEADAFRSLGLDRRAALWAARALDAGSARMRLPLFDRPELGRTMGHEAEVKLPPMPLGAHVVEDYRFLSLSLKAHPFIFLRDQITRLGVTPNSRLRTLPTGRRVTVAGLVLVRQRPGSASGVIFATLEDDTGVANIIVWPKVFETFRPVVLGARLVLVTGRLQNESNVVHVVAEKLVDQTGLLAELAEKGEEIDILARVDEVRRPGPEDPLPGRGLMRHPRNEPVGADLAEVVRRTNAVMPKGRNFH